MRRIRNFFREIILSTTGVLAVVLKVADSPSTVPASAARATAVPGPRTSARGSAAEVDSAAVAGNKSRYLKGNILGSLRA